MRKTLTALLFVMGCHSDPIPEVLPFIEGDEPTPRTPTYVVPYQQNDQWSSMPRIQELECPQIPIVIDGYTVAQRMEWYGELKYKQDLANDRRLAQGKEPKRVRSRHGFAEINGVESQTVVHSFRGYDFRVHERVVDDLKCISQKIDEFCSPEDAAYEIIGEQEGCKNQDTCISHAFRFTNSFHGPGISSHATATGLDINPGTNWIGQRETDHPQCWIEAFEYNGWIHGSNKAWRKKYTRGKPDNMHYEKRSPPRDLLMSVPSNK